MTSYVRVHNVDRAAVLGENVGVADAWWSRCRGLLGRRSLPPGHGLWLSPCKSVHMVGMRFEVDVAFVSGRGVVVGVHHGLRPGFRVVWHGRAAYTLELPSGTLKRTGTEPGDRLDWQPASRVEETPSPGTRRGVRS